MAIFCNQNQQGLARRPHKHKPKTLRTKDVTGGMSTKLGKAKKSSLNSTKRSRINPNRQNSDWDSSDIGRFGGGLSSTKRSRINPKRPGPQEARDKDSSDIRRFGGGVDQTFADQPPHPPGCAPRGHGTGIPAILDDLMEATPKKTPVSSPKKTLIFANFHQLQSLTPVINSYHQDRPRGERRAPPRGCSTRRQTAVGRRKRR